MGGSHLSEDTRKDVPNSGIMLHSRTRGQTVESRLTYGNWPQRKLHDRDVTATAQKS